MTGARRCILITGTFAVAFLAALVPAAAAAASLSRPARAHGAPDPNAPSPSTVAPFQADPSGPSSSDPAETQPAPTLSPTQPAEPTATEPAPPTDPPSAPAPAATDDPVPAPAPPPAPAATDPPVRAGRGARPARPAVAPRLAPVLTTPAPSGGWADQRGGGQGPDPGSQPHPVYAQPQAQDVGGAANGPWSFLSGPDAGAHLFVAGFVALLFSIGGLVTVGIRRHRW